MKKVPIEFRVVAVISVGACLLASLLWRHGDDYLGFGYAAGDAVYAIGSPLTQLLRLYVNRYGILKREDDVWAIPVMDLLLVVQMFVWAAMIYGLRRLMQGRKH